MFVYVSYVCACVCARVCVLCVSVCVRVYVCMCVGGCGGCLSVFVRLCVSVYAHLFSLSTQVFIGSGENIHLDSTIAVFLRSPPSGSCTLVTHKEAFSNQFS